MTIDDKDPTNATKMWQQNEKTVNDVCDDAEKGIRIANNIMVEMDRQQDIMDRVKSRLYNVNSKVGDSQIIVKDMKSKLIEHKLLLFFVGILILLFLIFCLIIVVRFVYW